MEKKMIPEKWLLDNSDIPIKYILTKDKKYLGNLLDNFEVTYWLSQLKERAKNENIGDIHGSHDYRMENILGKCWILGLSKATPVFSQHLTFIIDFLNRHIDEPRHTELSFNKIYSYRDYETVLACFLPMLGFADEAAVKYICEKRINILYGFTKQKRYNIYVDGTKYKGVKKEWQPYIIDPGLYADGNIALPDMHDFILFAGMYDKLEKENKDKIETVVKWIFDDKYMDIIGRYGYFYIPGGTYNVKAIITKMNLINFESMTFDNGDLCGLIFTCYILSHFGPAKRSEWFKSAIMYLTNYKTPNNRYIFPKHMITEKKDCYVIGGGHMNVGENKKTKQYGEIISTYWMKKILDNL
jgi:hypothetical protein